MYKRQEQDAAGARAALGALESSGLLRRHRELAARALARGVPLALDPALLGPAAEHGALACVEARVDLVARDPDGRDRLILLALAPADERGRAAQLALARAVARGWALALGSTAPPRVELWLADEGRALEVPVEG